jgi:hypothetical protein
LLSSLPPILLRPSQLLGPLPSPHAFDRGLTVVSSREWLSAKLKNPFELLKQEPSRMPKLSKKRMPFRQNKSDGKGSNRWQKKQEEKKKNTYQALKILSPKSTDKKKRTLNLISKYPINTLSAKL